MWWPFQWLVIYVIGGVTFVPLVVVAVIYYALTYGSTPVGDDDLNKLKKARLQRDEELREQTERSKVAAATGKPLSGWLTIRRQFSPGEKTASLFSTTPTTDLTGAEVDKGSEDGDGDGDKSQEKVPEKDKEKDKDKESVRESGSATPNGPNDRSTTPSTYSARIAQTYRQVMEARQKKDAPPKEYFYCVLKGSVLFLYEDEEQSDCVAAIGVDKYVVSVEKKESEGEKWPGKDAEMFAKRNAVVLRIAEGDKAKKGLPVLAKGMQDGEAGTEEETQEMENAPWFLFSKSNTKMEDWYIALVQASALKPTTADVFSTADMRSLVDVIDTEPDPIPMRWFNAMLGRVFFGVYRTAALEEMIIGKIMKKLSKVPRPSFLGPIVVREVNVGTFPPIFSKPMLKDLTAEGTAAFEVHMAYKSQPNRPNSEVRITIATTATIPTGFKPYVVDLVLAVVLKSIEGNMIMQIKKPPSNRVWYGFTHPPKMEVEIVPIVSERKIQIGMVLKAIEKQMREVIAESVVLPNMDDIAFFDTSHLEVRGGIFSEAGKLKAAEEEGEQVEKPAADLSTSAEDPSSATAETATVRKRRPTKSQTMDANRVSVTAEPEEEAEPTQGISRTETAPAGLATGPTVKKTAAIQATRKWFAQNSRSGTMPVHAGPFKSMSTDDVAKRSGSDSSGKSGKLAEAFAEHPPSATETAHLAASSTPELTGSDRESDSVVSMPAGIPSSLSSRSIAHSADSASDAASVSSDMTATSRDPSLSSSSLISTLRTRDKKAIQSQVNLAKDNLKKGWANFAAKRRSGLKGHLDERDEDKPAALYHPPDEDADVKASGGRASGEYRSFKERLDAAAHATAMASGSGSGSGSGSAAPLAIPNSRERSNTASSKGSIASRPSLLSSPSKTASVHTDMSTSPQQWAPTTSRPTTEIQKDSASATPLASTPPSKSPAPQMMAGSTGRRTSNGSATVMLQPSAGRGMVVPRVPKRPGEVTGLGSHPTQGLTRRISGDEDGEGQMGQGRVVESGKGSESGSGSGSSGAATPVVAHIKDVPPPLPPRKSGEEARHAAPAIPAIPPPLPPRTASPASLRNGDAAKEGGHEEQTNLPANVPSADEVPSTSETPETPEVPETETPSRLDEATSPQRPPSGLSHPPANLTEAIEADMAVPPPAPDIEVTSPTTTRHDDVSTEILGSEEPVPTEEQPQTAPGLPDTPTKVQSGEITSGAGGSPSSAEHALRKVAQKDEAVRAQVQVAQDVTEQSA